MVKCKHFFYRRYKKKLLLDNLQHSAILICCEVFFWDHVFIYVHNSSTLQKLGMELRGLGLSFEALGLSFGFGPQWEQNGSSKAKKHNGES